MAPQIIKLHALAQELEALGCWKMARIVRQMIKEALWTDKKN